MKLHPGQERVISLLLRYPEVCVIAGRGWGKSFLAAHLLGYYALQGEPGWVCWWVSRTRQQAMDIGWTKFEELWSDEIQYRNTNDGLFQFRNGVRIRFLGTEVRDPDEARGRNLLFCVWDEPFICGFAFHTLILKPALRHEKSRLLLIGTVPQVHEDFDPMWISYIRDALNGGWLYLGTSRENEGYGLSPGWTDKRIEEAERLGMGPLARREYLCDIEDLFKDQVVKIGDIPILARGPIVSRVQMRVLGIDPHTSRANAWACVEYLNDGRVYIESAGYEEQPLVNLWRVVRDIESRRGPITHWAVDPQIVRQHVRLRDEFLIGDLFYEIGMPVQAVKFSEEAFLHDIRELIREKRLIAGIRAKGLIEQLSTYTTAKATGKFRKRFRQQFDLVDALRYAMGFRFHVGLTDAWLQQKALEEAYAEAQAG